MPAERSRPTFLPGDDAQPATRPSSSSPLGWLLRELGRRFGVGWRAAPADARKRWLAWVAGGFVVACMLVLFLVHLIHALEHRGTLAWERPWEAHAIATSPISISSAIWFQTIGTDITLWLLVLLTGGIAVWAYRPFRGLAIVLAYVVLDLVVRIGWATWHRHRPDLVLGGAVAPGFASFPSGHTGKTIAVYGTLAWFWARAARSWLERVVPFVIVAVLDVLTAYGRMRMGAHWPTDLMGGFTLGLFWLILTIVALEVSGVERSRERPG
ncbi:MAG TPA: phosphatase PAP2 family protein [Longimicrobiales bacterium]